LRYQVAIVLQGRQAGKKVIVIKQLDEGTKERPYPHAVVAGIERYPRKVTKRMGQKKLAARNKVKPFIKVSFLHSFLVSISYDTILQVVNYSHLFPTRYALELEGLKGTVGTDTFKEPSQREDAKKVIKKLLEERYTSGKHKWFFTPLRVRFLDMLLSSYLTSGSFSSECPLIMLLVLKFTTRHD
jgi:large subunit ribosomal protein L27e